MAKLVVEVHNATDLMPRDGHGWASPFVEVEFDGQRQRIQTKPQYLNPQWNENLAFNVCGAAELFCGTVDVTVYNDCRDKSNCKKFLGRLKISISSIPFSSSEASVQRYPLDKPDLFYNVKGDNFERIHTQIPKLGVEKL